jgi:REP element-mobilizing transposase RayT
MTSHAHMIIGSESNLLENIVRDLKRHTSENIRTCIQNNMKESRKEWLLWITQRAASKNSNNTKFQFWQQHNHPIELADQNMFNQKLNYVHTNPVVAGFVNKPEDWLYSSANGFAENKGLIKLHYAG